MLVRGTGASASASSGGADGGTFKLDPARLLYSLRWQHNAEIMNRPAGLSAIAAQNAAPKPAVEN
jgi:hypothetical protein